MKLILYSASGSNSSERVEWFLNYKSIPYHRIEVSSDELGQDYLKINSFGYVPCLSVDNHFISESMAIIECLEELFTQKSLIGESVFKKAAIREVCEYVNSSIHSPQNRTVLKNFNPALSELSKRELRGKWIINCLMKLSEKLNHQSQFAVGNSFTIADIFIASIYKKALQHGIDGIELYDNHLKWLRSNHKIRSAEPQS